MDFNTIKALIIDVGFPIVCVLAMGYFIWRLYLQSVERENKLYTQLDESREINAKAIDTIAHYAEKLDMIQHDVQEIKHDVIALSKK